jgi:hypothetical protein
MTSLLTAVLIMVPAPAEGAPSGAPPTLQFVKFDDKGVFRQTVTLTRYVPVQKTVTVNVNGQLQTQTVTEVVPQQVQQEQVMNAKDFDIYDQDGKLVDESTWKKALAPGGVVLLAGDGKVPHPAYVKAVKPGTLILVGKLPRPMGVPPVAPPPPIKTPPIP